MPIDERLITAAEPLASVIFPAEKARREHELEQAVKQLVEGRDFLPLRSPDGSLWRIRVSNTGALTATKVV